MGALRRMFGVHVRQLRRAAGLTQQDLGVRAGMDYKYIGAVERGERNVTLDNVERIVRALSADPCEVFAFRRRDAAVRPVPGDAVVAALLRRTAPDVRPLVMEVAHAILRWRSRKPPRAPRWRPPA